MCYLCDAIAPVCANATLPDWMWGSPKRVPSFSPPQRTALTGRCRDLACSQDAFPGAEHASDDAPQAPSKRILIRRAGACPAKPAIRLFLAPCILMGLQTHPNRVRAGPDFEPARQHKAASVVWFDKEPGLPNDTEILFLALLVVKNAESAGAASKWAADVLRFSPSGAVPEVWPPPGAPEWAGKGPRLDGQSGRRSADACRRLRSTPTSPRCCRPGQCCGRGRPTQTSTSRPASSGSRCCRPNSMSRCGMDGASTHVSWSRRPQSSQGLPRRARASKRGAGAAERCFGRALGTN